MESLIEKFDKECNCSDNIESVLAQIKQPKKTVQTLIQLMHENHSNPKVQWHGLYELMRLTQRKKELPLILECVAKFMHAYPKVQIVQHYGCLVLVAMTSYDNEKRDIKYELILDLIINAIENFPEIYQLHREALNTFYNIIPYCKYQRGLKIMNKITLKYPNNQLIQTFKQYITRMIEKY